jgi:hypothetical protein
MGKGAIGEKDKNSLPIGDRPKWDAVAAIATEKAEVS